MSGPIRDPETGELIDVEARAKRLATATVAERPVNDELAQRAWDRLHAFGFVKPPVLYRVVVYGASDEILYDRLFVQEADLPTDLRADLRARAEAS